MMSQDISGNKLEQSYASFLERAIGTRDLTVYQLTGDASTRRYYRVTSGPNSWVLMSWDPFEPKDYPFLSVCHHFAANQIQVPNVMDISPSEGYVLLEDLGDLTLERKYWENQNQELVLDFYQLAIDEIIKIHYPASFNKSDCTAFKIAFDTKKFMWEMNYAQEHLLEKLCQLKLTESQKDEIQAIFLDICTILDKEDKYISHRDYHSRNLMITRNKMRVIDFQDARLGPIQYDLVSLLKDSYVDLSEKNGEILLDYYLTRRREYIPQPIDRAHFDEIYEIQTIQRCFKACGSFASFYNMRNDTRYLKHISKTLATVMKSLIIFPKWAPLTKLLIDNGVLEKKYENIK